MKRKGKRYGRRTMRRPTRHYYWMPVIALVIFFGVVLASRAGWEETLRAGIDNLFASVSLDGVLDDWIQPADDPGVSAGDSDAEGSASQAAESDPDDATSQPEESDPDGSASQSGETDPVDVTASHPIPDYATVSESVLPEVPEDVAPPANVSSLTIDGGSAGTVFTKNDTDYTLDIPALLGGANPVKLSSKGVQVLIMHTHGSEAYTPDGKDNYTPTDTDRTTDCNYNVVRVGDEIAKILESKGISTIHSTVLNDYPQYNGSYDRALEDITAILKENPAIKVVIDVHRDAMISQNGTKYKTVANINGRSAAQLMFVCGTDQGGLTHQNWKSNLTFQLQLHNKMNTLYPGIMRPLNIRTGRFNQHVTTGSMLLEVGTSGNTLDEALYSAQLFANVLADTLNATR